MLELSPWIFIFLKRCFSQIFKVKEKYKSILLCLCDVQKLKCNTHYHYSVLQSLNRVKHYLDVSGWHSSDTGRNCSEIESNAGSWPHSPFWVPISERWTSFICCVVNKCLWVRYIDYPLQISRLVMLFVSKCCIQCIILISSGYLGSSAKCGVTGAKIQKSRSFFFGGEDFKLNSFSPVAVFFCFCCRTNEKYAMPPNV